MRSNEDSSSSEFGSLGVFVGGRLSFSFGTWKVMVVPAGMLSLQNTAVSGLSLAQKKLLHAKSMQNMNKFFVILVKCSDLEGFLFIAFILRLGWREWCDL